MSPASQGYTLCDTKKGFLFLALVSSTEGWMGWALQLHGSSEPHGMEISKYHIVLCGSGPGMWIWVADLQKGVTQSGYLTSPFTAIRRKNSFLREIEHSSNVNSPGLSFSTFKPSHRAYGAEPYLFPDLSGVSPVG